MVTYIAFRLYVCPPIQEEGDGGKVAIEGGPMEGGPSLLQQGHKDTQTVRDTGTHWGTLHKSGQTGVRRTRNRIYVVLCICNMIIVQCIIQTVLLGWDDVRCFSLQCFPPYQRGE